MKDPWMLHLAVVLILVGLALSHFGAPWLSGFCVGAAGILLVWDHRNDS